MTKEDYTRMLQRVRDYLNGMALEIVDTKKLDSYFKGDLDGSHVWIDFEMEDEEELFNVLHIAGHSIQWGLSDDLKALGSKLHEHPDDDLLLKLQTYEWEANCYGLGILHALGITELDQWMYDKYSEDMCFLTHFYKTGEKLHQVTDISRKYAFLKPLEAKRPPKNFVPTQIEGSRDGIVIDFGKE